MSANQRHRLASETEEERADRLQQMRDRLASETEEERAARLQQMRDRLASETEEERAARLQQMSANQHHRLAAETGSERERPDYSVTGKGKEDNSHSCLCLNSPLFRLRCGTFMQRLLRWKCRNALHARRRSQAFSFAHTLLNVCAVTETSMCQSCTHPCMNNMDPQLTLAPTMLCIHLVYNSYYQNASVNDASFTYRTVSSTNHRRS